MQTEKELESIKQLTKESLLAGTQSTLTFTQFLWGSMQLFDDSGKLVGSVLNPMNKSNPTSHRSFKDDDTFKTRFSTELRLIKTGSSLSDEMIYECFSNDAQFKVHTASQH
jgi:hypothetical protein